jgi:voltage-gated potassium channel
MGFTDALADHYVQHRFTALFSVLLLTIAGHGFIGSLLPIENPLDWLLGISLVAVVFSARRGGLRWVLGGLAAGSIAARLTQGLLDHPPPAFLSQALLTLTCLLAAGVAVHRALGSGRVNAEHICAALDAYLLAGLAFGFGYCLMEALLPGSFASASGLGLTPPRAIYFSFVTQATLGFGDIVPIREHAQGVVIAQGVGGQMYLAVLVARLVSLYSAQDRS